MQTKVETLRMRIRELCAEYNISEHKLSTRAGINRSTLATLMTGDSNDPKFSTLSKIAQGFEMSISEFLDFTEIEEAVDNDDVT